jgi:hypothetical protein
MSVKAKFREYLEIVMKFTIDINEEKNIKINLS